MTFNDLPGHTKLLEHSINTGSSPPMKQQAYRIPLAWQKAVQEEIQQLLELGVIRQSRSPWNSSIVTVRKKDGSYECVSTTGS